MAAQLPHGWVHRQEGDVTESERATCHDLAFGLAVVFDVRPVRGSLVADPQLLALALYQQVDAADILGGAGSVAHRRRHVHVDVRLRLGPDRERSPVGQEQLGLGAHDAQRDHGVSGQQGQRRLTHRIGRQGGGRGWFAARAGRARSRAVAASGGAGHRHAQRTPGASWAFRLARRFVAISDRPCQLGCGILVSYSRSSRHHIRTAGKVSGAAGLVALPCPIAASGPPTSRVDASACTPQDRRCEMRRSRVVPWTARGNGP